MSFITKYTDRVKKYGRKYVWTIILHNKVYYPIDDLILRISSQLYKKRKLENFIIIESHNDFDCNGGAFYNFLIKNNYNEKYKIIWFLKNGVPDSLPNNVCAFNIYKPSFKKSYYNCVAKYLVSDDVVTKKINPEQISVYLSHGAFGLKDTHGLINVGDKVDYLISPSEGVDNIIADQWSVTDSEKQLVHLGYPSEDIFYQECCNEYYKITDRKYTKTILWMPTFRQGLGFQRQDTKAPLPYGIPLITSLNDYRRLDNYLREKDMLLVVKLHPMQNLKLIEALEQTNNIKCLSANNTKHYHLDTYRLMKFADALLSDYSSVAYSFLHLKKPIGYVLSDLDDYSIGVCVDNIDEYLVGERIISFDDLLNYLDDVASNNDKYENERERLSKFLFKYHDGNSCERLAKFLKL